LFLNKSDTLTTIGQINRQYPNRGRNRRIWTLEKSFASFNKTKWRRYSMSAQDQEVKIVGDSAHCQTTYNVCRGGNNKEEDSWAPKGHGALKGKWEFPGVKIEDG
jgi:hypothetical protein